MIEYEFVVGVDPSLKSSGVAVWQLTDLSGSVVQSTVVKVPSVVGATLRDDGYRISKMVRSVCKIIDEVTEMGRALLLIEGPIPHMANAAKQHERAGVFWGISTHCLRFADIARVPPGVLKKYWTGNGSASKEMMMAAVEHQWPRRPLATDDEADALALAHMGFRAVVGPTAWLYPANPLMLGQVDWPAEFKGRERADA